MSEPPKKRQRKPTLRAALEAARKTGRTVKRAVVEPDGKITLSFGDEPPDNNEWDERLSRGKH